MRVPRDRRQPTADRRRGVRIPRCERPLVKAAPHLGMLRSSTIVALICWLTLLTACTASSAATEPPVANNPPSPPTPFIGEPSPEVPLVPSVPLSSPAFPTPTSSPPVSSPQPSPTATLTPPPTPAPSLQQLTSDGCCVQPEFSLDGSQVLFIDKPGAEAPTGVYGIDLGNPQPTPVLVNEVIGFRNQDWTIVATLEDELAYFSSEASGETWTVNTGGNWPAFSPDSSQILWVATDEEGPYDRRRSDVWWGHLDGSNSRLLLTLYGGGFAGWFPDGQRLLFMGRDDPNDEKRTLFVYDLANERRTNLFSHKRLRGGEISEGGSWVSFFITFADEPSENGLWVVSADGATQRQLDLPNFGGYRWRDDDTLLFIPMRESSEKSMQLWAIEIPSGQLQPLTDPASLSFSISNGDWDVSPDGRRVVFVNNADNNIWLITLP